MARRHVVAVAVAALALPVLAQEHTFQYQDERGSAWSDDPAPPGEGSYNEYPPPEPRSDDVDVSVDFATPGATVSFDTFRDGLAPYGEWVNDPRYGRVWRPANVAANWRPYYYGRWEWTDEGWLWVSDEPWGWAAYHYGRWAYDGSYGWVWIPGYQWAPAWVSWRYSPDYIGWAPLGPGLSVYVTNYPAVYGWWTFVPCHRFVGVPVWSAAYGGSRVRGLFHATLPAPPRAGVYGVTAPAWGGPARPFLERRIGHAIAPVRVQPVASPSALGHGARAGVVPIYRPEVRAAPGGRASVLPPARGPAPAATPGRPMAAPAPGAAGARPWGGTGGAMRGGPAPAATGGVASPAPALPRGERNGVRVGGAPASGPRYAPAPGQGSAPAAAPRYSPPAQRYQPAPAPRPQGGGAGPPGFAPRPQGGGAGPQGFAPRPQGGGARQQQGLAPRGQGATVARPQGGSFAAPRAGAGAPRFGGGGGGAPRAAVAHGGSGGGAQPGGHRR